ncbi:Adenosylmethionine-8-amino-7-oxononanoate aminotransferase [hydrothermal vent metagenome]|uniref:Adenosylmethionine-8-amino-7-oxononanoate aminotransferase n=1 Tax=hydrothermal vent metagenome TaxID=652676 RepID=A0A3B1BU86_9ZZZZ
MQNKNGFSLPEKFDDEWERFDRDHIWHPYSALPGAMASLPVSRADGVRLILEDGRSLIDGMASWWCVIHGYNHPVLNKAVTDQLGLMAHVMFGGLTHRPAIELAKTLTRITPPGLEHVFFSDSGSVAVEVAIKMAIQYWRALGRGDKQKLVTARKGYHGDTFGAMSVCDPVDGMHHMFTNVLARQFFVDPPRCRVDSGFDEGELAGVRATFDKHHSQIAAFIIEPVVQGAGGMRIYAPEYLRRLRALCDEYDILLVLDEIATGFGRTGKLFACEHAGVEPDILCLGKAMTGGYMTLAATLTTRKVGETISEDGAFMHGPTFMASPLACRVAKASIDLLLGSPWESRIKNIENRLTEGLSPCLDYRFVKDVRVIGAIGVIELNENVDIVRAQKIFMDHGVWIRPFRNLIYIMPPYIIEEQDLARLTEAMGAAARMTKT